MVNRFLDSGEHSIITSEAHSPVPATAVPASRAAAGAAVTPAPSTTVRARTARAAASVATHPAVAAELPKSSDFLEQKSAAVQASSVHAPGPMDLRDRLFAGISETSLEEQDENGAEVIIEPDGRIKVHPRRRPGYLRYGGALEPSGFGAGLEADQSAGERDARAAKDLLLLRLLRPTRQTRSDRASVLESLLEDEISKLLIGESTTDGPGFHSLAELETGNRADPDSSSAADSYAKSRVLTSPAGYFVAFIVGFGGILLIAMLCCVIRAAYVKRQKALLKKLLSEKLGEAGVEKPEEASLATPATYEVVGGQEHAAPATAATGADTEWIDVRVDQQAPPEEEQLMNVARLDTLSKTGEAAGETKGDDFRQLPQEPKRQREKSAIVSLWGDEKLDEKDSKDKRKTQKKSNRLGRSGSAEKTTMRRGKELKKVLSSRRSLRRVG